MWHRKVDAHVSKVTIYFEKRIKLSLLDLSIISNNTYVLSGIPHALLIMEYKLSIPIT